MYAELNNYNLTLIISFNKFHCIHDDITCTYMKI